MNTATMKLPFHQQLRNVLSKVKTYKQFTQAHSQLNSINRQLSMLGINVSSQGFVNYEWENNKGIKEEIEKYEKEHWPIGTIAFRDRVALALAETEEYRNDYLQQHEIDFVNEFFDLDITQEIINRIGSRFI